MEFAGAQDVSLHGLQRRESELFWLRLLVVYGEGCLKPAELLLDGESAPVAIPQYEIFSKVVVEVSFVGASREALNPVFHALMNS